MAGDSQFKPQRVFHMLGKKKIDHLIPWRRFKGKEKPSIGVDDQEQDGIIQQA